MAVRIYKAIQDDGTALWPEERTLRWLLEKRNTMPLPLFNAQYQNDPSGLKGVRYDADAIRYYLPYQLPEMSTLLGCQGGDPATSEESNADYFGHVTAAKAMETGTIYILDMDYDRVPSTSHVDFLQQRFAMWMNRGLNIQCVRLEASGAWTGMAQMIQSSVFTAATSSPWPTTRPMPIEVYKPKGSKLTRLDGIMPYIKNATVLFKGQARTGTDLEMASERGFEEFFRELTQFPKGRRDDLLDALFLVIDYLVQTSAAASANSVEVEMEQEKKRLETKMIDKLGVDEADRLDSEFRDESFSMNDSSRLRIVRNVLLKNEYRRLWTRY